MSSTEYLKLADEMSELLDSVDRRMNPAVREIVAEEAVGQLREKFAVGGVDLLSKDAADKLRAAKLGELDKEADQTLAVAEASLRACRQLWETEAATARVLRTATEALPDNAGLEARINAQLLDEVASDRAERWIDKSSTAAVLARYKDAKEAGADRAFVRVVEALVAAGRPVGHADGDSRATTAAIKTLRETVAARQAARVPATLTEALGRLPELERRTAQWQAVRNPTQRNVSRALARGIRQQAAAVDIGKAAGTLSASVS